MVSKVSFEGTGLRLVMAVGNALFFANIKADYKWGNISYIYSIIISYYIRLI
jgi:WD repeat-containing protein 35